MTSKEFVRALCEIVFMKTSYVVIEENGHKKLKKSTLITNFINKSVKKTYSEKISKSLMDLCYFYMYPEDEEKSEDQLQEMQNAFIYRVIYFLTSLFDYNFNFLLRCDNNYSQKYIMNLLNAMISNFQIQESLDLYTIEQVFDETILDLSNNIENLEIGKRPILTQREYQTFLIQIGKVYYELYGETSYTPYNIIKEYYEKEIQKIDMCIDMIIKIKDADKPNHAAAVEIVKNVNQCMFSKIYKSFIETEQSTFKKKVLRELQKDEIKNKLLIEELNQIEIIDENTNFSDDLKKHIKKVIASFRKKDNTTYNDFMEEEEFTELSIWKLKIFERYIYSFNPAPFSLFIIEHLIHNYREIHEVRQKYLEYIFKLNSFIDEINEFDKNKYQNRYERTIYESNKSLYESDCFSDFHDSVIKMCKCINLIITLNTKYITNLCNEKKEDL